MSSSPSPPVPRPSDRAFYALNAVLSVGALAFLAYILVLRRPAGGSGWDLSFMPAVNAALNATSATCLVLGWVAIRRGRPGVHRAFMVSALTASALFLVGYVAYHYVHGDTRYGGTGAIRAVYLSILASHVLFSLAVVPLALSALWFALKKRFDTHKKVTKWALPIWLYVSVTGVVVFWMLHG